MTITARQPATTAQRPYVGSVEQINGLPPAADQQWGADEANDHTETLTDHAEHIDSLSARTSLQYVDGFSGSRTWVLDNNGVPVDYHAADGSTAEQRAQTRPGADTKVWVVTELVDAAARQLATAGAEAASGAQSSADAAGALAGRVKIAADNAQSTADSAAQVAASAIASAAANAVLLNVDDADLDTAQERVEKLKQLAADADEALSIGDVAGLPEQMESISQSIKNVSIVQMGMIVPEVTGNTSAMTAALKAAITAANAGGLSLGLLPGFTVNDKLQFDPSGHVVGLGTLRHLRNSEDSYTIRSTYTGADAAFCIEPLPEFYSDYPLGIGPDWERLSLVRLNDNGVNLKILEIHDGSYRDLDIHGGECFLEIDGGDVGSWRNVFSSCHLYTDSNASTITMLRLMTSGASGPNNNHFNDCKIVGGQRSLEVTAGGENKFNGTDFSRATGGTDIPLIYLSNTASNTFIACGIEQNFASADSILVQNDAANTQFIGGSMQSTSVESTRYVKGNVPLMIGVLGVAKAIQIYDAGGQVGGRHSEVLWTPIGKDYLSAYYSAIEGSSLTIDSSGGVSVARDLSGNFKHALQSDPLQRRQWTASDSNAGGVAAFAGGLDVTGSFGLVTPSLVTGRVYVTAAYKTGLEDTFLDSPAILSGPEASTGGGRRVMGRANFSSLNTAVDIQFTNEASQNAGASSTKVLPMPPSVLVFDGDAQVTQEWYIGYLSAAINRSWPGPIVEVVFTDGTESDDDRDRIVGMMAHRAKTVARLPAVHPYKDAAPLVVDDVLT